MKIKGNTRLIGLFGHPVSHTLSPAMHNPAFAAHGLDFAYVPLSVAPDNLEAAVQALRIFNFRGANVTIPHKEAVIPYLDKVSETANLIGAVNTIINDDGILTGTTTDPEGFLEGYREAGFSFEGKSIAILGNGGSARTIAFALYLLDKPSRIFLVGRNEDKLKRLQTELFDKLGRKTEICLLERYGEVKRHCHVVIQTTPVGMHPDAASSLLQPDLLDRGQTVYDIVYIPEETALLRQARNLGLAAVGGLGMLVHQGIASFHLWTGIRPEPSLFYENARLQLRERDAKRNHPTS